MRVCVCVCGGYQIWFLQIRKTAIFMQCFSNFQNILGPFSGESYKPVKKYHLSMSPKSKLRDSGHF